MKTLDNPPNRCRELRLAAGYGLTQFASLINVKPPTLFNYETKGTGMGKEKIYEAAALLQTDFSTLDRPPIKISDVDSQMT